MRRQSVIAIAIALVLGIVAVYLANTWLSEREARIAAANQGTTEVAVAAVPLAYGAPITPDKVRFAKYPTDMLPAGVFTSLDDLLPEGRARHALRPIEINQPLLAADLTGEGEGASIAALLPDGMRAATVRINAVSGVAGFIKPNDTVDVLITRQAIGGGEQVTDVLLQNIRVIAMDQDAQGQEDRARVSNTATLEVTPVEAQKLALGQRLGSLSLVLRKPGEEENIARLETVSLDDLRYELSAGYRPAPREEAAARPAAAQRITQRAQQPRPTRTAPAPRPKPTVEVTRGLESETYEVGE
ncbi:Flp pilus assembly protein CpaB [Sphingomicrobium astaxanthinifaciens]|uniref:Flp pilus assembly protein CpaB n=1 Tax=Sphingomicrobium astaxanthinifaciens TaxID=1227949 RepID=UPI001FCB6210|nr:Flp pilus assembly protein CpaB [Sphingomicrobium astaxanthinifaciens]MCJ7421280.1 Flp pilus assembly protein CpaB [Sphingomicrobium astaxanthinifaciens]